MSELEIINGNENLICCFGGMALQFGMIPPFEFLNYLTKTYENCDLLFYIDKKQCWYHRGIEGITENIDETVEYLNGKINRYNYRKVIFMGVSAGGYGAILFGSLCVGVTNVIAFIPQTVLTDCVDERYKNLKDVMKEDVRFIVYGNLDATDDLHNVRHVKNIEEVCEAVYVNGFDMKKMRDGGEIKGLLNKIIFK